MILVVEQIIPRSELIRARKITTEASY